MIVLVILAFLLLIAGVGVYVLVKVGKKAAVKAREATTRLTTHVNAMGAQRRRRGRAPPPRPAPRGLADPPGGRAGPAPGLGPGRPAPPAVRPDGPGRRARRPARHVRAAGPRLALRRPRHAGHAARAPGEADGHVRPHPRRSPQRPGATLGHRPGGPAHPHRPGDRGPPPGPPTPSRRSTSSTAGPCRTAKSSPDTTHCGIMIPKGHISEEASS
ncbi:hypothetical protein ACFSTC_34575 [Nonomuraea ferruginea]